MARGISRRKVLGAGLTVAGAAAATAALTRTAFAGTDPVGTGTSGVNAQPAAAPAAVSSDDLPWQAAKDIVAATALPSIPAVDFDATKYGVKGDGKTDNTAAFKAAVTAVNHAGGGRLVVPSGTYLTGAIYLMSNVNLYLGSGATLKFSGDVSLYPTVLTRYEGIECMNHSPMIYAYGEHDIALTGSGTLDAGGTSSWNTGSDRAYLESLINQGKTDPHQRVVPGSGHTMRSTFVEPYNCQRVLIQGVTLKNPMFWQLHPTLCTNVTVDSVHTDASTAHSNTDGCDPECCDHVIIKNSVLGAHDDNIAIKSGRDADGRRINKPTTNVVVFGCTMNGNWGAITCGSEITGGVSDVYAYKCTIVGATKFALYLKTNTLRGGGATNVFLDSFSGAPTRNFAYVTSTYNSQTGSYPINFGNINITNCTTTAVPKVFDVEGTSGYHVHGFKVSNCSFNGVGSTGNTWTNVDGRVFANVKENGATVSK
jgi:polygalacturonase